MSDISRQMSPIPASFVCERRAGCIPEDVHPRSPLRLKHDPNGMHLIFTCSWAEPQTRYTSTFTEQNIKGIVQRKLTGVETRLKCIALVLWCWTLFLILKRHHLGFFKKRFAATKAQKIKIFYKF